MRIRRPIAVAPSTIVLVGLIVGCTGTADGDGDGKADRGDPARVAAATVTPTTPGAPPLTRTEVAATPSTEPSDLLPGLDRGAAPAPLLGDRLPSAAEATGRLVAAFPADLAPPEGVPIEASSVSVAGRTVQAALVARVDGDPRRLLHHYRTVLAAHGFGEVAAQAPENAPVAAFRRGGEAVTVTVQDGRAHLLAVLRARGH